MEVIAIIPAYNEEKTIAQVVEGTKNYIKDVLVIDDASTDNTPTEAYKAGAEVVTHILNQGVGGAQRTGYHIAFERNYDYIVQLDGDGQHNPEYIPQMIKYAVSEGYDILIGSRFLNSSYKKIPYWRKIGIKFFTWMVNFFGKIKITDVTSGYRVYKTEALKKLTEISDKNWAIEQTLEAAVKGLKIGEYSVEMPLRNAGQSQFDFKTAFRYPFRIFEATLRVLIFRR